MKYIITDRDEAVVGTGFHADLAKLCKGKVIRAGHCNRRTDGTFDVSGWSVGFDIDAKPEDAEILKRLIGPATPEEMRTGYAQSANVIPPSQGV